MFTFAATAGEKKIQQGNGKFLPRLCGDHLSTLQHVPNLMKPWRRSSMRMRIRRVRVELFGFFQRLERQLARNGRESLQESFEGLSTLKIIEQGLDGHPRSAENGRTVHDCRDPSERLRHTVMIPYGLGREAS